MTSQRPSSSTIALRIDVDFEVGLRKGVPKILSLLETMRYGGSFFVTMGPDSFGRNKSRISQKGYIKRMKNMNPVKIFFFFGPIYVVKNLIGISKAVPDQNIHALKRIVQDGHDIGIHGYDHFWWSENVYRAKLSDLITDFNLAREKFKSLLGFYPKITGSPNWRTTNEFIKYLDKFDLNFFSEGRSSIPVTKLESTFDSDYSKHHISITLPCLHEISDYKDTSNDEVIFNEFFSQIKDGLNVWCIHDYYEGLIKFKLFKKILIECSNRNINVIPLSKIYFREEEIKNSKLEKIRLAGGRGEISWLSIKD